jgi:hypothetical protein
MNNLKRSSSGLWECGFREAVSKPLWEVWESRKTFPRFPRWRHFHKAFLLRNLIEGLHCLMDGKEQALGVRGASGSPCLTHLPSLGGFKFLFFR